MIKSLAKFSIACVLALSMGGCAADAADSPTEAEEIASAENALLGTSSTSTILVQALVNPETKETVIDITTASSFNLPSPVLHSADLFRAVAIYIESSSGKPRLLGVFGGRHIGPGGGCIHFHDLKFRVGDVLRVGAVVNYAGEGTRIAASAPVTAQYINPPGTVPAPHFDVSSSPI